MPLRITSTLTVILVLKVNSEGPNNHLYKINNSQVALAFAFYLLPQQRCNFKTANRDYRAAVNPLKYLKADFFLKHHPFSFVEGKADEEKPYY